MKTALLPSLILLALPLTAVGQFEGYMEMKITAAEAGGTSKVWISKAGVRSEMDMKTGPRGEAQGIGGVLITSIHRTAEPDLVYTLNEKAKTYSVIDTKKMKEKYGAAGKANEEKFTVKRLGSSSVAGFACENVLIKAERGGDSEACFAKEILGSSTWMNQMSRGQRDNTGLMKAVKDAGVEGFPVRWIHKDKDKTTMTMELVKAEKKSVPASMLEIPADYKETDMMSSMMPPEAQKKMQEMMKNMTPEQRKQIEEMMKKQGAKN